MIKPNLAFLVTLIFSQNLDNTSHSLNPISYIVQISAWVKHKDAEKEVTKLEKLGYNPYIEEYSSPGKILWRVRIGPFEEKSSAIVLSENIYKEFLIKTWIVSIQNEKPEIEDVIDNNEVEDTIVKEPEAEVLIENNKVVNPVKIEDIIDNNVVEDTVVKEPEVEVVIENNIVVDAVKIEDVIDNNVVEDTIVKEPEPEGCDGVPGSGLVLDECGVCNGDGISVGKCDCEDNVEDCFGECGGLAELDECGICYGDGIPVGECDCVGNVEDCAGECGGTSEILTYWFDADSDGLGSGESSDFCSGLVEKGWVLNNDNESTIPIMEYIYFDIGPKQKSGFGINPIYPESAKATNIEGKIIIQFFIDKNGNVTEAYVQKGVPGSGLDKSALDAVKKSKWIPAKVGEKSIGVWQLTPINFEL